MQSKNMAIQSLQKSQSELRHFRQRLLELCGVTACTVWSTHIVCSDQGYGEAMWSNRVSTAKRTSASLCTGFWTNFWALHIQKPFTVVKFLMLPKVSYITPYGISSHNVKSCGVAIGGNRTKKIEIVHKWSHKPSCIIWTLALCWVFFFSHINTSPYTSISYPPLCCPVPSILHYPTPLPSVFPYDRGMEARAGHLWAGRQVALVFLPPFPSYG